MSSLAPALPRPVRAQPRPPAPQELLTIRQQLLLGAFFGMHAVLAGVVRAIPAIGLVHAFGVMAIGMFIAVFYPVRMSAYTIAYLAGAEVFWRMARIGLFWEYSKYSVSAVALVCLFRMRLRHNKGLPVLYLALLLPSAALTITGLGLDEARQELSFNLAGPVALTLCILYFSNLRLAARDVRLLFLTTIGPVIGIAALSYFSTAAVQNIEFTKDSNSITSGGFGPNQVSAMLGLGLFFCVMLLFQAKMRLRLRIPIIMLAMLFGAQAALTFSRGGLALAAAGAFMAIVYLARDRRTRITLVIVGTLLALGANFVIVPALENFTKGKLSERYSEATSSGRTKLAGMDLEIFADHPLLGVGPGMAPALRGELGHFGAAHTEYTRLLSEHGLLGAAAGLLLLAMAFLMVRKARTVASRAQVAAFITWVLAFLAIDAMRMVAPCFMFGLACSVAYSSIPPPKKR